MTATPTTPKGLRTYESILQAARTVFSRDGFVGARMGDVAEEAGLSMGGLYRYFGNKEAVFEELIGDIHRQLYEASRSTRHRFADSPYDALLEANTGYLQTYYDNRYVMRAFIEAAAADQHFRQIWWDMRSRHARRFAIAYTEQTGVTTINGVSVDVAADAMACLVEQTAFVWFGHDELHDTPVGVDDAARIVTHSWYRTFFDSNGNPAQG